MYSDIIPPKKNSFINTKHKGDNEVRILKKEAAFTSREIYHTIDGKDKKSKLPIILFLITVLVLSIVYYSVFNNNTYISFESKTIILEVKDSISMTLSEKNQNSSTTLSYNLIYANEVKDRNIFAPIYEESTSTDKTFYTLNATTTSDLPSKKIILINESNTNVQVIDQTRFDVGGETYYLQGKVSIKPTSKEELGKIASSTNKYKVIGFKNTSVYDRFYAVDYIDEVIVTTESTSTDTTVNKNIPNEDILSLIPENFIPLKKGYVFDNSVNQSALVVIDKKDFEKVLYNNSRLIQEYVKVFTPILDIVEYEININDYEMTLSADTGLPSSFKNLTLEITPRIKKDKAATVFKGFSKETMKKIKADVSKNIDMSVKFSPFWMSKVSDEDHINVEVK